MVKDTTPEMITGWRSRMIRERMQWVIIAEALKHYRNPVHAFREIMRLREFQNKVNGTDKILKFVKSSGKYFWSAEYCGFPSYHFNMLTRSEFTKGRTSGHHATTKLPLLKTVVWGITNRCPLACSHCYEWDPADRGDQVDLATLEKILELFIDCGIRHLQFSGGEPLVRFNDLVQLVRKASPLMDCWLLTSGYGLTPEKAVILKKAGLTGAHISLDHWDEEAHNYFRNNQNSFEQVKEAVRNSLDAGIIVSLSLCATREFVSEKNLMKYADLALRWRVQYIRILEPRAAGKFAGQNVLLDPARIDMISEFTIRMNTDPRFRDFPSVNFLGYHQRHMDCFGAGNRFLYVDPAGNIHACPFCRGIRGNMLNEPLSDIMSRMKDKGCQLVVSY